MSGSGTTLRDGAVSRRRVAVVGAGLGGSLMALYLARAGFEVDVFERRGDPRGRQVGGGRSINLAISTRGLHALAQVGLDAAVLEMAVPMRGRMIHGEDGSLAFQRYSADPHKAINSVSRSGLNELLIEAADAEPAIRFHFENRCVGAGIEEGALRLADAGGASTEWSGEFIVGADGAWSAVRRRMQRGDRFDYSQSFLSHGYKELTLPAAEGGGFRLESHALHIWPRGRRMMIALPNADGSFTCTLFWPMAGEGCFDELETAQDVRRHFERHYADALPLLPRLESEYLERPASSLVTIRCRPWHAGGRGVLIGDAAHAIVPFFGQGANAAFEDCYLLARSLERHGNDAAAAFAAFSAARKPDADALAELSIENFRVMAERTASRWFRAKKAVERAAQRLLPRWYETLYSMVSFSRIPYAAALRRHQRRSRALTGGALVVLLALLLAALAWLAG